MDRLVGTGTKIDAQLKGRQTELFDQEARGATELAYFVTGDRDLSQDIAQEAFVRLFGRFANLRNPDAFRAYLRKTVINLARSHFRKRKHERNYLERQIEPSSTPIETRDLDSGEDLFRVLQSLPQSQRAALVLRFYFDLSEHQTAEILGRSSKAVNGLVTRGLNALRERLDPIHD